MTGKILITGGAGYIGTALTERLVRGGYEVTIYDSLLHKQDRALDILGTMLDRGVSVSEALLDNSPVRKGYDFQFVKGDIRDRGLLGKLFRENHFDYAFHFSELVGHYCCEKDPVLTREINFGGTVNIVDRCSCYGTGLIYNSSSSVYGERKDPDALLDEDAELPNDGVDNYCLNKRLSEAHILEIGKQDKSFEYTIFRPATVGGLSPRMRLTLLPNHFTYAAMTKGKLSLAHPNNYRAVIDIEDLVEAYMAVLENGSWDRGIFNVGHYNESKSYYVEEISKAVAPLPFEVSLIGEMGSERNLRISSGRFIQRFGVRPRFSFRETIGPLIELLKEKPDVFSENNYEGVLNTSLEEWKMLLS